MVSFNLIKDERTVDILRRIKRHKMGMGSGIVFFIIIPSAVFAPVIAPYSPSEVDVENKLSLPTWKHPMGGDNFGRDVFSRLLYGGRFSLYVAFLSIVIGLAVGVPLGAIAGYYLGILETAIMRTMDALLSFPWLLLAIVFVVITGRNVTNAAIAIGIIMIPQFARITRSVVLDQKSEDYVQAARCLGSSNQKILFTEILPNSLAPIMVSGTLSLAVAILTEVTISFIGLGVQPPNPSWGNMLFDAKPYFEIKPWLWIAPGLAIMITVLAINFFGDALRDALDPRMRGT